MRASSLTYNLLTLSAELRDVELAAIDTADEPFGSAGRVGAAFGARTLLGQPDLQRLSLTSPRISIRHRGGGSDNLPAFGGGSDGSGITLPALDVEDLDVVIELPDTTITVRDVAATMTIPSPGEVAGRVDARRGVSVVVGGRTHEFDAAGSALTYGGHTLGISGFTVTRPGTSLEANGTLTFGGDGATTDLNLSGSTDLSSWQTAGADEAAFVGQVDVGGRVTGALTNPTATVHANGRALAWSGIEVAAVRAAGRYHNGVMTVESYAADLAGGTVEGRGAIALDAASPSRLEARWSNVDARQLPNAPSGVADVVAQSGSGELRWRGGGEVTPFRLEVEGTTGVVAAGRRTSLVVRARGEGDRWRVDVLPGGDEGWDFRLSADVRVNKDRWQSSAVDGRLTFRTSDARAAIERARDFGVPLGDIDTQAVAGSLDVEATLGGTLGASRGTGRVQGRGLTVAEAPPADLMASFDIDVGERSSTGHFRVAAADLSLWRLAGQPALDLRGSATAAGTWSGPLANPVVEVTLAGQDLGALHKGSIPVALTAGAFDATLTGSIDALRGRGRLAAGDVNLNGSSVGVATLDLTLEGRSLAAKVSAPGVNTTIDGSISLATPYAFVARGATGAVELSRLTSWSGAPSVAPDDLRGTFSASFETAGDLTHPGDATTTLAVAPLDATVYGVALRAPAGFRATLEEGQASIDEFQLTLGAIVMRAGGDLRLDEPAGGVSLAVNGDLSSLGPWLARIDPEQHWTLAGRVDGTLGATRTSAGVTLNGSLASAVTSVAHGERVLARDTRVLIELAGSRAVVRNVTGQLMGGALEGSGEAPLTWLNGALPDGWQIQSPATDSPATASLRGTFDLAKALEEFTPGRSAGLGGRFVAVADLSAPRPDLAAITGILRFDRAELTSGDTTLAQTDTTRLRLAAGQVNIESLHWKGPSSEFTGRGVVGLLPGARTDARLDVDSTLGVTAGFLKGRATGRLAGTVALAGAADRWRVTADAALADARWIVPEARVLFSGWSGRLRLDEDAITLAGLNGLVNGGSVKIDGRLSLAPSSAGDSDGIRITAKDILLEVPEGLRSQVSADLGLRPEGDGATLDGTVTITANQYTEPVTRVLALVHSLSGTTGGRSSALPEWLAATRLAVDVVVTDPVIVDNSVSSIELVPSLRVVGTLPAPALDGRIDVVDDGRIRIGGRTYSLRESRLRFAPADGLAPTLQVMGETRVGDYDVVLRIRGTPDSIETIYSSRPPLGQRELQSLILTGRIDAAGDASDADNFAAAAAATDILGFAGKFVGLDSVKVGAADLDLATKDVNTDQHLTISKSLGSRFELIFSDNLETGELTWLIAWRPGAGYEVRAASVENTSDSLEVRQIVHFGPGTASGPVARESGTAASAVIVADLVIDGSPGFPEDVLRRELHLEPGDRFSVRRWIDDRLRLENFYRKRGYHRVRIAPTRIEGEAEGGEQNVTLRYAIDRGPKTIVETVGDDLPSDAVSAIHDQWRGIPVAEVLVGQFEDIARKHLAERGYYRANVSVEFTADTPDLAQAVVQVERGPRTRRQAIVWAGNAAVSTVELDALVPDSPGEFDAQAVEWGVQQLYRGRGYQQARIQFAEPVFDEDVVTRTITIDEGRLSRIVDVALDGVAEARLDAARAALDLSPGTPFVFSGAAESMRRLQRFYRNLGYRDASVSHVITPHEDGDVSVAVTVAEGTRYEVGAVRVAGVESTNEGLVRDAITLAPGGVASEDEADATRRNLFDIGSFRHVDVSFVPPALPAPAFTDLSVQVEEPQRFQLRYGGQIGVDRSVYGENGSTELGATVELRDRNFIGRAVQASISAHYSPHFQTLTLLMTAPRLLGWSLPTNVYARERREELQIGEGSILDRRREVTLTQRKLVKGLELAWGYDFAHRVFLLTSPAGEADLGGLLAGPKVSVVIDRRDSPLDAKRGWFHSSSVQLGVQPLGSDLGYARYFTRQSFYRALGPVILAGNARLGLLEAYSGQVPLTILDEFFQAGGSNTVRGYSDDALSALSILGVPVGGTEVLILNGEVRFPIRGWFTGAAFVDGGNTFISFQDVTLGELAVGAGLGIRVHTPFVPFRFDFGYPMTAGYEKRRLHFHFSVGQMF
ncbi:MAG TPA: translocation/assembly module TamB domain-containing protein [Vicinamibacterales bacterium]|nr:translocation/assembly module TamB domain-containing protein [Vicinamibacterales bacterium]